MQESQTSPFSPSALRPHNLILPELQCLELLLQGAKLQPHVTDYVVFLFNSRDGCPRRQSVWQDGPSCSGLLHDHHRHRRFHRHRHGPHYPTGQRWQGRVRQDSKDRASQGGRRLSGPYQVRWQEGEGVVRLVTLEGLWENTDCVSLWFFHSTLPCYSVQTRFGPELWSGTATAP